jgi:hypothetical protein
MTLTLLALLWKQTREFEGAYFFIAGGLLALLAYSSYRDRHRGVREKSR